MPLTATQTLDMGRRYADAWCAGDVEAVVAFFEEDGRTSVNDGEPIVGHAAIADTVKSFYNAFPDLRIHMDDIRSSGNHAVFVWTLTGTSRETGQSIRLQGWEEWTLSDAVRFIAVRGWFDAEEYERQLREGCGG